MKGFDDHNNVNNIYKEIRMYCINLKPQNKIVEKKKFFYKNKLLFNTCTKNLKNRIGSVLFSKKKIPLWGAEGS